jgi:hypothetical protein
MSTTGKSLMGSSSRSQWTRKRRLTLEDLCGNEEPIGSIGVDMPFWETPIVVRSEMGKKGLK